LPPVSGQQQHPPQARQCSDVFRNSPVTSESSTVHRSVASPWFVLTSTSRTALHRIIAGLLMLAVALPTKSVIERLFELSNDPVGYEGALAAAMHLPATKFILNWAANCRAASAQPRKWFARACLS
jgi:hypothetical protein